MEFEVGTGIGTGDVEIEKKTFFATKERGKQGKREGKREGKKEGKKKGKKERRKKGKN